MVKVRFALFFLFVTAVSLSQQTQRIAVAGEVIVTKDEDKELVSIYNASSEKGVATNAEGKFTIEVALNDRVVITALQFQSFTVIVDEEVLKNKRMKIYLNPYVNKLDEVFLSSYNLTGFVGIDAKNIDVIATPDIKLSFDVDADFAPDRFSRIEGNVAQEALGYNTLSNGVNITGLIELLAKAIFPKKDKSTYVDPFLEEMNVVKQLQEKYPADFYAETYGLPLDSVDDFLHFADVNAVTSQMLQPENELKLLQMLLQQSVIYKERYLKD
ncbi:MAG: hypothetical protein CMC13_01965 [Flavobacteriaceae bacterium]|nr:hypothetical protein [Flavobacteriaceae bacterium]